MPQVRLGESEFDAHLEVIELLFRKGERFGLLVDAPSSPPLDAKREEKPHVRAGFLPI
jgi:hypothetical protein